MSKQRRSILYITPIMPRDDGNGLAMRAGAMLEALAAHADVHLCVVPVAGDATPCEFAASLAKRIHVLPLRAHLDPLAGLIARITNDREREAAALAYPKPYLARFCTGSSTQAITDWAREARIDCVHVMRLYLAPLAELFIRQTAGRPFCVLDLDDDDVHTFTRLAALHADRGDAAAAARCEAEAQKFDALAARLLRRFDSVLLASGADAVRLRGAFPTTQLVVVPNICRPVNVLARHPADGTLRVLFVGNLSYAPNADAAQFLCTEILPRLRSRSDRDVRIDIVGNGADALALPHDPAITVHGFVDDLASIYASATIAVAPIRAGGGTRIKILEAFAHNVPVVATRLAAEGIEADDQKHLLLGDDPISFAACCLRIADDPLLAASLVREAASLAAARYSPANINAALAAAYGM